MKLLKNERLYDFFRAVSSKRKLYLPVDTGNGLSDFRPYAEGLSLSERLNTSRSAKDFFFPQMENLVHFKTEGGNIEVIDGRVEHEDFVLFGVRACDAKAFEILDRVYIYSDPVDSFYKNRREHGLIITLACDKPTSTCFCHTFGIDMTDPKGGDISAYKLENGFAMIPLTDKGSDLLSELNVYFSDEDCTEAVEKNREEAKKLAEKLPLADLDSSKFDGRDMIEAFKSTKWASLSEACLGCGTCTFVCPTCQCYDIKDFKTSDGVTRFRCWDSCMYSDFTKMAGGQPRLTQLERFRQRFMHKLIYFPMNNDGMYGCVGCGRCLSRCPIHMNIVKVMKELGKEEAK